MLSAKIPARVIWQYTTINVVVVFVWQLAGLGSRQVIFREYGVIVDDNIIEHLGNWHAVRFVKKVIHTDLSLGFRALTQRTCKNRAFASRIYQVCPSLQNYYNF